MSMGQVTTFLGAFNYEFRMQIRRAAVWITMTLIMLMFVGLISRGLFDYILSQMRTMRVLTMLVFWTNLVNSLLPIVVGCLLADRLPRDRKYKVQELLQALPGSMGARITGKYIGGMLATLVPLFAFYWLGVGYIIYQTNSIMAIPLALETFLIAAMPGIVFISAFSIACPAFLWVPVYQFLFVGYWFWGNWFRSPYIPSLSNTILTPVGGYISIGFFGKVGVFASTSPIADATLLQGIESMLLLIGIAVLVMVVLCRLLKWQQERQ
ncbi:hypothetical protein EPA93_46595 [Ktedonosporobacter rubrisoli]|uniref:Uncharacterized protein n=1 Tax=Ktedonosporobacter rubrisoli TaxID=2509675 RepID=A0A4P6K5A5_KTERU|nr:hypothetical protein [Ktedonosporobacter rubrisoli]QBD83040.1 hypothetical protein EPA93_46595 [Ktedonosporobacter rubrisoli]